MSNREKGEKCSFTHNISCKGFTIFIAFINEVFDIDKLVFKAGRFIRPIINPGAYMKLSDDDFQDEVSTTFTTE